jgi:hypothetical protein
MCWVLIVSRAQHTLPVSAGESCLASMLLLVGLLANSADQRCWQQTMMCSTFVTMLPKDMLQLQEILNHTVRGMGVDVNVREVTKVCPACCKYVW